MFFFRRVWYLWNETRDKHRSKASQDRATTTKDQTTSSNKVALETEKENDSPQKEMQECQRVMEPKRTRTHAPGVYDDQDCEKQSSDDWDLSDYRRETVYIQNRRSVVLDSHTDVPTPPKGQTDPLDHSHMGLVAWVSLTV
jgi:hypothetical protein